jgi:hypothetical protein
LLSPRSKCVVGHEVAPGRTVRQLDGMRTVTARSSRCWTSCLTNSSVRTSRRGSTP